MLYENEVFQALHSGQKIKGFVKQVRSDGKIDLILQKIGIKHIDPLSGKILDYIKEEGGVMDITDKSPAEVIYAKFGVSKRAFKQALGKLYKRRLIEIAPDKVSLIKN
jgi:predicted RNA-binding protein (virulence factor B family)